MLRKLMIAAALALTTAAATVAPAPAIDFICSCSICKTNTGLKCWDTDGIHPASTYCGAYYPTHC
jgi:hypothetical protein